MALSTFPFLTATGDLRNRSVDGSGTTLDPDVAVVRDILNTISTDGISAKIPTLGQKAISGSVSIVPATNASILINQVSYLGQVRLGVSAGDSIKATSGNVFSLVATNLNASTRYIQLFNQATAPTLGNVPLVVYPVFGSNLLIIDTAIWGLAGIGFSTGISWGYSTTPLTYTAGVNSDVIFEIRYN